MRFENVNMVKFFAEETGKRERGRERVKTEILVGEGDEAERVVV